MENIRLPEWLDGECSVYLLVANGIKKGWQVHPDACLSRRNPRYIVQI